MTNRIRVGRHLAFPAFALAMLCALAVIATQSAQAQTFNVIHYFTGGTDGGNPTAGVTVAGPGILYGTEIGGHPDANGGVFKLTLRGSSWTLNPLHQFTRNPDGSGPVAGVVFGPNGALYGTTADGGVGNAGFGQGTVFEVQPPANACKTAICYWNETVLHAFAGGTSDGAFPQYGNVVFDQAGNMYGTTSADGTLGFGNVWELTPSAGGWTETILYNFTGGADGRSPYSGVTLDAAGNLYGVTPEGGSGTGTLYQLVPSNGGWTENTLVQFNGTKGIHPYGTLIKDAIGNFYGTARDNGPNGGGTVFELSPANGGGWNFSLVYAFSSCSPQAGVTLGPDGDLYGACQLGGTNQFGWIFRMPLTCNQSCTPNDLHDFNYTEGASPMGPVSFDASGNMYGTTIGGGLGGCMGTGPGGCGLVWEITPQ